MQTSNQTVTAEIVASSLPANEKIKRFEEHRRMLKTAVTHCTRPETTQPGGRFYPMYAAMKQELAVLEAVMAAEIIAANT